MGYVTNFFMRATLLLLFVQMLGTITPIFLFPGEIFSVLPYAPTLEGQYIIKNIVLVSTGIVIGATVRGGRVVSNPEDMRARTIRTQRRRVAAMRAPFPPAVLAFMLIGGLAVPSFAQRSGFNTGPPEQARQDNETPVALRDVRFEQRLNEQLPLDAVFKDEMGQVVRLGDYFGERPAILALVYYECPMLCNQVLNGLLSSVSVLSSDNFIGMTTPLNVGEQFDIVAISFDSRENERPGLAAEKKQSYVDRYNRPGAAKGWHFLTGTEDQIRRVTDTVGFYFAFDPATNQFAHASGITVLTPEGRIARYFYGIEYAPKDLRLGLIEASNNRIGSPVDQLLLYCYHYDPSTGKYGAVVMNVLKLFSLFFLLGMSVLFVLLRRWNTHRVSAAEVAH